ncbi:MAG: putative plasmid stabilization system protein [Chitinophagaceae bacterium]|nr:putative plasmid stabilization system protein [Chitinophagaceae bacterium]
MHQLILKSTAIQMAKDAYNWYEEQQNNLGEIFLESLDDCFKRIESHPKANRKIKKNYRQARLRKFPYVVIYEILKTDIVVFSIFHTSRDPRKKFK